MALAEGTKAPALKGPTDGGGHFDLKDARGSWVVLFFYPKDDTTVCTKEACNFRDNMNPIVATGTVLVGISPDSVASHDKFKAKFDLNYPLLSDEGHAYCETYDVWKEKSLYGHKYMGVERTTYIVNPDGIIVKTFPKVRTPKHAETVLKTLKALGAGA